MHKTKHTGIGLALAGLALMQLADNSTAKESTDRFIDTHVHFNACKDGALDQAAEWMKSNNVQRVINHPLEASRPGNDEQRKRMLENYSKHKGRIDRFCIIKPDEVSSEEEAVAILKKEKADGAIGFGEHYGEKLNFDDPKNMLLYAACDKVGLPVMFHMDNSRNLDEKGLPRLQNVLKTYPNLILIAHSSGWWKHLGDGTCDELLTKYPNLYADISCTAKKSRIGRDREFGREFIIKHVDKLLYGSDAGWWSFRMGTPPEYSIIDEYKLPEDVEEKLLRGNALKLFPVTE